MQLEFHQLDRRLQHLRARDPRRQRRLLAWLAESGQQTPIIVVPAAERYLVIDGHQRVAALEQLGRDTVEAVVWEMSEAEALLLAESLRSGPAESALEQGWLLAEMRDRCGYSLEELARRFHRSASWVSRRLGLVELLPESIQQQVREGRIAATVAMKYLAPVARVDGEQCRRMADALVRHACDTREAGQLYAAWRQGTRTTRERILSEPELFLKTQRQPPAASSPAVEQVTRDLDMALAILRRAGRRLPQALVEMNGTQQKQAEQRIESARRELMRMAERAGKEQRHVEPGATDGDPGVECPGSGETGDRARAEGVAALGAPGAASELHGGARDPESGEGRTVPPADPGALGFVQGESRASP